MAIYYYRHNVDRYDRDTGNLTPLEHGIYRLLIDAYMKNRGPLEAEERRVFLACKAMMPDEQDAARRIVARYFVRDGDVLRNGSCDDELTYIRRQSAAQSEKAKGRHARERAAADAAAQAAADAAARAAGVPTNNQEKAKATPPYNPPPPKPSRSRAPRTDTPLGHEPYTPEFEEFWAAYPAGRKGGKWDAFRAWEKLHCAGIKDTLIADIATRSAKHRKWLEGFQPEASRYLNGRLWHEPIDETPPRPAARGSPDRRDAEQHNHATAQAWAERED